MALSKKTRFAIFARDGFTCRYCGKNSESTTLEVDHLYPRSKGGTDDPSNLVTACFDCNRGKSDAVISIPRIVDDREPEIEECDSQKVISFRRSLVNWEWYSCPNSVRVFTHLLLKARGKESMFRGILIPAASVWVSASSLAASTGLTRQKVRTVIKRLLDTGHIETRPSHGGTLIQITNYTEYTTE